MEAVLPISAVLVARILPLVNMAMATCLNVFGINAVAGQDQRTVYQWTKPLGKMQGDGKTETQLALGQA